ISWLSARARTLLAGAGLVMGTAVGCTTPNKTTDLSKGNPAPKTFAPTSGTGSGLGTPLNSTGPGGALGSGRASGRGRGAGAGGTTGTGTGTSSMGGTGSGRGATSTGGSLSSGASSRGSLQPVSSMTTPGQPSGLTEANPRPAMTSSMTTPPNP